jgi:rod shape determining protein RodA
MIVSPNRYFKHFDWISFGLIFILACIGLAFIFSATYKSEQPLSIFFKKQLFGVCAGIITYFVCSFLDYRILMRWGYSAYLVVIALLVFTLIKGKIGMGGQRWIDFVFFRLQASELAKLFFPAFVIHYLYQEQDTHSISLRFFLPILITMGTSFLLILKQPDLGTALVLLCCGLILLWCAGINKKFFSYGLAALLITAPISWHTLKSYQKQRVLVFLGYGQDNKERYQIEQSKIAIGSGGFLGKGFLCGTQNKLLFLPESRTDFIFSVIAEEIGFCGALLVLILYTILFLRLLLLISTIKNIFIQLLSLGIIIPIMLSALINLCMVMGLLPIVGIPLPLISYGLSNLWVTFASFGWLSSIIMHRSYIST